MPNPADGRLSDGPGDEAAVALKIPRAVPNRTGLATVIGHIEDQLEVRKP